MVTKFFTLDEANALLPKLNDLFLQLEQKRENHSRLHDTLFMHELLTHAEGSDHSDLSTLEGDFQSLEGSIAAMQQEIEAIQNLGCVIRSLERGWVDFPAERNGEVVYFCWQRGEEAIRYYHLSKTPATERLPLDLARPIA